MQFEINEEYIDNIQHLIEEHKDDELLLQLEEVHHADIAEIIDELDLDQATYILSLIHISEPTRPY